MEIINDWVDEEFYFDLKITPLEIVKIADGEMVIKKFLLNGQSFNFSIIRTPEEPNGKRKQKRETENQKSDERI